MRFKVNLVKSKKDKRLRRARRQRKIMVAQINERPRLSVYRSGKHIYGSIYAFSADGLDAKTLLTASTIDKELRKQCGDLSKIEAAQLVGSTLAKRAKSKGIEQVQFDRSGYKYHGRVKALAEGAREGGLDF
ncbi:MAG: 50S ribosomal protein L18 [Gammaproteobacteria bacterium]